MKTIKGSLRSLFALVLFALIIPQTSFATVEMWRNYGDRYGSVLINASENGNIYPSRDYLYKNEIPALSLAVSTLLDEDKLSQRTFIFNIKSSLFVAAPDEGFVSISNECFKREAEEDKIDLNIDKCYVANISDKDVTHEKLMLIILAAQKLQGDVKKIDLKDLQPYKQEFKKDMERFAGKTTVVDPKWSPDGKFLLQAVWKDGAVLYEVIDMATNKSVILPGLEALPMVDPQWSYDSQYIAYASAEKILIYNVKDSTVETITLSQYLGKFSAIDILLLSFDPEEAILFFAFDVDAFNGPKSYLWNAKDKTVKFYRDSNIIPWLDKNNFNFYQLGIGGDYNIVEAVVSPVGGKIAAVTKMQDGLTTVKILDKNNEVSGDKEAVSENNQGDINNSGSLTSDKCPNKAFGLSAYIFAVAGAELLIIIGLAWKLIARKKQSGI